MTTKERLHHLVEKLPEGEVHAAERFLEFLVERETDPLLQTLADAPRDEEPLSEEDREAIRRGREDVAAGRTYSTEALRRALDART